MKAQLIADKEAAHNRRVGARIALGVVMKAQLIFERPTMRPFGDGIWELLYDWTIVFRGEYYSLPAGTLTDGASIPPWLWWLCGHPLQAPRLYAALVHDWLYDGGDETATRADADDLYRNLLIALGMPRWKAYIEWAALRVFGGKHWCGEEN